MTGSAARRKPQLPNRQAALRDLAAALEGVADIKREREIKRQERREGRRLDRRLRRAKARALRPPPMWSPGADVWPGQARATGVGPLPEAGLPPVTPAELHRAQERLQRDRNEVYVLRLRYEGAIHAQVWSRSAREGS